MNKYCLWYIPPEKDKDDIPLYIGKDYYNTGNILFRYKYKRKVSPNCHNVFVYCAVDKILFNKSSIWGTKKDNNGKYYNLYQSNRYTGDDAMASFQTLQDCIPYEFEAETDADALNDEKLKEIENKLFELSK